MALVQVKPALVRTAPASSTINPGAVPSTSEKGAQESPTNRSDWDPRGSTRKATGPSKKYFYIRIPLAKHDPHYRRCKL